MPSFDASFNSSFDSAALVAVVSISVQPNGASIDPLATQQMTARGVYSDGTAADITGLVVWASSDITIATLSGTGLATGVATGTVTVTATLGAVVGLVLLSVATHWPFTNRLPEFRTTMQRCGFVEIVLSATPASAEWTAIDLWIDGGTDRAPSRNRK